VLEVFNGATKKTLNYKFKDVGENGDSVPALISFYSFSKVEEIRGGE